MKQCKHRYGDWCHNPKQEHQEHCAFYLVNQNQENCSWFEIEGMKMNNIKNILIFVNSSWGEIEWILPVCNYIKKHYPEVKLSVLVNAINSDKIIKGNDFIFNLLNESVDRCCDFTSFLPKPVRRFAGKKESRLAGLIKLIYCRKVINAIKPDIILKGLEPDKHVRKRIVHIARKQGCRDIMYPHSSLISISNPKIRYDCVSDDILCNTDEMKKLFPPSNNIYKNETHVVGMPKYDEWWINYLIEYWGNNSQGYIGKDVFLFFTRNPHADLLFSDETANQMLHDVIKTVLSYEKAFLVVKPHPRQNLKKLREILEQYDSSRWVVDQSQAMCLSSIANVIICMGASSVCLDALAVGKPVIEYYKYTDIKYNNEYGELGLIESANNMDELKECIDGVKKNNSKGRLSIKRFREIIPKSYDGSIRKTVGIILGVRK